MTVTCYILNKPLTIVHLNDAHSFSSTVHVDHSSERAVIIRYDPREWNDKLSVDDEMHDGHVLTAGQIYHADSTAHVRWQHVCLVLVGRFEYAGGERAARREYVIALQAEVLGEEVGFVPGLVFGERADPRLAQRLVVHHVGYGTLRQQVAGALQHVRVDLRQAQPYVTGPSVLAALDLDEEHLAGQQRPFTEHNGVGEAHLAVGHRVLVVHAQVEPVIPVEPRLLARVQAVLLHAATAARADFPLGGGYTPAPVRPSGATNTATPAPFSIAVPGAILPPTVALTRCADCCC